MADDKESAQKLADMVTYEVRERTKFLEHKLNDAMSEARKFSEQWDGNIREIIGKSHTQLEFGPKTLVLLERIAVALETLSKKSNYVVPTAF